MANVDPNLYALSIQLDLDTGDAFSELDAFGDQIGQIEQDIADTAQKSINEIGRTSAESTKALDKTLIVLGDIKSTGEDVGQAFADASSNSDIVSKLDDELAALSKEHKKLSDTYELWEEFIEILENKNELHEDEFDLLKKEEGQVDNLFSGFTKIVGTLGTAYWLLTRWADRLSQMDQDTEKFVNANFRLYGSQQQLLDQTRMLTAETGIFYDTALEAMVILGDLRVPRNELEQYAKMVGQTNRVTGVSVDTLAKYANSFRMIGRNATSINDHLIELQESMRKFGLSAADMTKLLDESIVSAADLEFIFSDTNAPEKFRLMQVELTALAKSIGIANFSAKEFEKVLTDRKTMSLWESALGRTIRTVDDFRAASGAMADVYGQRMLDLQNIIDKGGPGAMRAQVQLEQMTKSYFAGSAELRNYAMQLQKTANMDREIFKLNEAIQGGGPAATAARTQLKALAKEHGLSERALEDHVKRVRQFNNESEISLKNAEYYGEILDKAKKNALDPFSEANDTLTAQLRMLKDRFWQLVRAGLRPLFEALKEVLKWINWFISGLLWMGEVLGKINAFLNKITFGAWGYFTKAVMIGVVVVGLFVLAIGFLAVALGGIPWMLRVITRAVVGFFKALGKGVAAFAKAVAKHTWTLLQLAVAFALVGAGAWMLAMAFKTVADYGWQGVAMFAVFLAIVFAFMAGLVILAAFIQGPIMVGLIVLGAVMLAIGAAAWLVGAAVQMMANAFMTVVIALQKLGQGGVLVDFSKALLVASLNIYMAAPILLIAAAMLIPAASLFLVASVILAAASTAFAFAVWMMGDSGDKFWHAMEGLKKGIEILVALPLSEAAQAILKLGVIGIGLIAAAIPFGIGAIAIGLAAGIFGSGMLKLSEGFKAIEDLDMDKVQAAMAKILNIFPSSGGPFGWIGDAAKMAKFVASAYLFGAAALALGFGLWILAKGAEMAATMDLAAVAANLREGVQNLDGVGPALLEAATPLLPAAWTLFWAGMLLHWGAKGLSKGAELMAGIGDIFIQAGQDMKKGAEELLKAMPLMYKAAVQLFHLAPILFATGVRLAWAGFWFNLGSVWIAIAVRRLSKEGPAFKDFADGMEKLALGVTALMELEPRKIVELADAMVIAAPKMRKAVKDLDGIGTDFDNALKGLTIGDKDILKLAPLLDELTASLNALEVTTDPLEKIATSLDIINQAVIQLDDNIEKLVKDLSSFGPALEQQAEQIELAAQRIHDAVENRGVPAMRAAQDAGLAEAQQGDVIATVQVMPHQEGRERNRTQELAEAQNGYLERLVAMLETLSGGEDAKAIHDLLAAVLPGMVDQDGSDLHNNMGQWS